jgi:hypothetical protein
MENEKEQPIGSVMATSETERVIKEREEESKELLFKIIQTLTEKNNKGLTVWSRKTNDEDTVFSIVSPLCGPYNRESLLVGKRSYPLSVSCYFVKVESQNRVEVCNYEVRFGDGDEDRLAPFEKSIVTLYKSTESVYYNPREALSTLTINIDMIGSPEDTAKEIECKVIHDLFKSMSNAEQLILFAKYPRYLDELKEILSKIEKQMKIS